MKKFPYLLIMIRLACGPALILVHFLEAPSFSYIAIMATAFVSDVFDGIIARRIGVSTEHLRRADGWADIFYYSCVFIGVYSRYGPGVAKYLLPLTVIALLETSRCVLDRFKFGKRAPYHTYSAKICGIFLFLGLVELFYTGEPGAVLDVAIALGVFTEIEALAASVVSSTWRVDVPSLYHALTLERAARASDP